MLRSYVTTAIRNLARDPFGTAISVVSMSAGFTSCLLIALYVEDEWQYDRWPEHSNRLYRLVTPSGGRLPIGLDVSAGRHRGAARHPAVRWLASTAQPARE